ncbi:hypothetical protein COLO4_19700 [Corchorus olitorius]|uniref:CCHC-type domain-containing protein n=1 Tax=Corchorus olitorius TaxID=93759 RepID=A0A1R3J440_9ROSI|nr:hypothetical protein COLO4_19700 [Corchorus olitorius]
MSRRYSPYLKNRGRKVQMQKFSSVSLKPSTTTHQIKMAESSLPNIRYLRECSWTDSDSPTEESEEDSGNSIQDSYPRPPPPFRSIVSHRIRVEPKDLMEAREEASKCIVGFLLDIRKFSTENVQRWLNQAWQPVGEVTVIGRDDDRYLIYIASEVDRKAALEQTPWAFQGALFATRKWNPNVPLGDMVLDRVELWLQIWGLPFEYQNRRVAEKLAHTAGEIIKIDWRNRRPRNIRFLRIRIALDPRQPLAPRCTIERDDGTIQWAEFRYDKITKLCLSCGMLGHKHTQCSKDAAEVDMMVRQRMRPITARYGHPIVIDSQNNLFTNRMRAFLHRASRRNTGLVYGGRNVTNEERIPNWPYNADPFHRGSTNVARGHEPRAPPRANTMVYQAGQGTYVTEVQQMEIETAVTEAQVREAEQGVEREMPNNARCPIGGEDVQAEQGVEREMPNNARCPIGGEDEEETKERLEAEATLVLEISETTEPSQVQDLTEEQTVAPNQPAMQSQDQSSTQPQTPQTIPPTLRESESSIFELPTLGPIVDPVAEYDSSIERLAQLEERMDRGFDNLADLEDIHFALNREHSKFKQICEEIVRQSASLLEGLQNRHMNDPFTQPTNNNASDGQVEPQTDNVGEVEGQQNTLLLGTGSLVNPTSPGFICTINEEDLVSAFLRDTPSPDAGTEEIERKRNNSPKEEQGNLPEADRSVRRRVRGELNRETGRNGIHIADGLRQAVPQQPPKRS